jgi:nicotinamide-nucleotide amidase
MKNTELANTVVKQLIKAGKTVAVAESLTGGGLGAEITEVAGSSEVFSRTTSLKTLQINEKSPRSPVNPYGVSHLAIDALVEIYRKTHNLKISLGIFFNHESK